MALPNTAPISNSFLAGVASGAIPGAASTTSNHAGGFPNSGGNGWGMMLEGSVDTMLQHGGLDGATTLGSMNTILGAIQGGAFAGDIFAVFEKYLGNLQTLKNFKSLFALGGVSLSNARLGLGAALLPSGQGQSPSQ